MNDVKYKSGIGFLLATLGRKAESLWSAFLQEHDMTTTEFTALSVLNTRGACTQKQLAQDIEIDPRNIVATVAKLHKKGWIASYENDADGRSKILEITPKGRSVLRSLYACLRSIDEEFFQNLTASERQELQRLLGKLKR